MDVFACWFCDGDVMVGSFYCVDEVNEASVENEVRGIQISGGIGALPLKLSKVFHHHKMSFFASPEKYME